MGPLAQTVTEQDPTPALVLTITVKQGCPPITGPSPGQHPALTAVILTSCNLK